MDGLVTPNKAIFDINQYIAYFDNNERFSINGLPGIICHAGSIDDYRKMLPAHSAPLMDFIEWHPTAVDVLNDTADLCRYFDCTEAAEFLYACVQRTVAV